MNGSVYTETIVVTVDNIVIDGNGSIVLGSGSGYGFNLNGRSNVTIYNVTVTGWQVGFYLYSSSKNNLTGNTASHNTIYGFVLDFSSNNNILYANNANNNTEYGFALDSTSNNNTFRINTANYNTEYGFALDSTSNNTLLGNTANYNTLCGFALNFSSYNNLTGNTANNNTQYGFALFSSSNNNLTGNTANYNGYGGFYIDPSWYNTLTDNNADYNTLYGFHMYNSSNNNLTGNSASNNNGYGFYLSGNSTGNNITGNTALNNTNGGYDWSTCTGINDFTGCVVAYYLCVNVTDTSGSPLSGADVEVLSNGTVIYTTTTGSNGLTSWIDVPYQTLMTDGTTTNNTITVTVQYSGSNITRTVDMSSSHVETFQFPKAAGSSLILPVLLLAGTQGGVSPMVYVAVGIAVVGVAIVAGLVYYFRRMKA